MLLLLVIILLFVLYNTESFSNVEYYPLEKRFLKYTLQVMDQALTEKGIKYWLMMETLLGAVRDKSVIYDDYNQYQIGTFIENKDKILALKIKDFTFDTKNVPVYNYKTKEQNTGYSVSIDIKYKGHLIGEITLYQIFQDGIMRNYDIKDGVYYNPILSIPEWFVYKLGQVHIDGLKYPVPRYSMRLLQHWYGETWYISKVTRTSWVSPRVWQTLRTNYLPTDVGPLHLPTDVGPLHLPGYNNKTGFHTAQVNLIGGIHRNTYNDIYDKYMDSNIQELLNFVKQQKLYLGFPRHHYISYPAYMSNNIQNVGSIQGINWINTHEIDKFYVEELDEL